MSSFGRFLVMIAAAGALGSAHAVERDRVADVLPAWSIAAPDLIAYDSGVPEHSGYRLASTTTVKYPAAERNLGLKRAAAPRATAAAPGSERSGEEALDPAPAAPQTTDWMLLLSGIVVAGFMARRRTRDVAP
jgi:hypothetical protein